MNPRLEIFPHPTIGVSKLIYIHISIFHFPFSTFHFPPSTLFHKQATHTLGMAARTLRIGGLPRTSTTTSTAATDIRQVSYLETALEEK